MVDTTTGFSTPKLNQMITLGIPHLHLSNHEDLCFLESVDQSTQSCGSHYDGSHILQQILGFKPDYDIMYNTLVLSETKQKEMIEYIDNNKIFCMIDVTEYQTLHNVAVKRNGKLYLSTTKFRQKCQSNLSNSAYERIIDTPGKASVAAYTKQGLWMDKVYCVGCEGLPKKMKGWFDIKVEADVQEANKKINRAFAYHLVPKCQEGGDPEVEWRVSFSYLENFLIKHMWSQKMRSVYTLLKCLIKRHVNMPEIITTYHLKTTMFLNMDVISRQDDIAVNLLGALDFLMHSFAVGYLQLFFMTDVNLLQHIPAIMLLEVSHKISQLRKSIHNGPAHLGIYEKQITFQMREDEIIMLIELHATNSIKQDLQKGMFNECCELSNPSTILYIWESYLYKALAFVKRSESILVRYAMVTNMSQNGFTSVWQEVEDWIQKFSNQFNHVTRPKCVYYLCYDGVSFYMEERPFYEEDSTKETVTSIGSSSMFYDQQISFSVTEGGIPLENASALLIRGMRDIKMITLKKISRETAHLYDLYLSFHASGSIANQIDDGNFSQLGDLHADPNTLLYMWQSYLTLAAQSIYPDVNFQIEQSMTSPVTVNAFATLRKYIRDEASRDACLFGYERTKKYDAMAVQKRLGYWSTAGKVHQMVYDGISFAIATRDVDASDKVPQGVRRRKGDIYFYDTCKILFTRDYKRRLPNILQKCVRDDMSMLVCCINNNNFPAEQILKNDAETLTTILDTLLGETSDAD